MLIFDTFRLLLWKLFNAGEIKLVEIFWQIKMALGSKIKIEHPSESEY